MRDDHPGDWCPGERRRGRSGGLAAAGEPVRASSRALRPGEFPAGVEVARADLADPASWPAALAGVRKVFL